MHATVSNDYGFAGMNHEDMKASYKRLIKIHHPDLNPNDRESATERTKILNAEFAYYYARAATDYVRDQKHREHEGNEQKQQYYQNHYNTAFVEALEEMIKAIYATNLDMDDRISVDIKGVFIWIGGIAWDMKAEQNIVKSLGFQGSHKKHDDGSYAGYFWKWTPAIKRFGSNANIDDISRKYGSVDRKRGKYGMTVSR